MEALSLIRRLHQHRHWVNQQLLGVLDSLPIASLQQSFDIGQGTIWKSVLHLYAAEYVWLEALQGNECPVAPGDVSGKLPGNQEGADALSSPAELRTHWDQLNERWARYLAELEPRMLAETVYKRNSLSGKRAGTSCSDVLLHVCIHAQYTTAQVVNMLRHVGVAPLPDAMLITLARQESDVVT